MAQLKGASAGVSGGATARSSREPVALTDQQWAALAPLVPGAEAASRGRLAAPQSVVEGILYAIRNGMGMQSVPPPYPSGSTLYRRYTAWTANGQWEPIWAAFLDTLSPAERRQWEAAAQRRPGAAAEAAEAVPAAEAADAPPGAEAAEAVPAAEAADAQPPVKQTPVKLDGAVDSAAQQVEAPPEQAEMHAGTAEAGDEPAAAPVETAPPADGGVEPAAPSVQLTIEAARARVAERLGLSTAESEIVRRRIDDHGVAAALSALDEVELRIATGTMRGVGGMPMSAFEIWVCAVGLARRPVERPRAPRAERNDRHDGDRDRRKRQWRKAP